MTFLRKGAPRIGNVHNLTTSTSASVQTPAISSQTAIIRVAVTQDTYLAIGVAGGNATATSSSLLLTAGTTEYYAVNGQEKIAALGVAAAGVVSVMELPNTDHD